MAHILASEAFLLQYKYSSQTSGILAFHLPTHSVTINQKCFM
jgi:hypothetical protein